jgi:hypothetical protein
MSPPQHQQVKHEVPNSFLGTDYRPPMLSCILRKAFILQEGYSWPVQLHASIWCAA